MPPRATEPSGAQGSHSWAFRPDAWGTQGRWMEEGGDCRVHRNFPWKWAGGKFCGHQGPAEARSPALALDLDHEASSQSLRLQHFEIKNMIKILSSYCIHM